MNKYLYANKCFGLPVEQIKTFDELTPEQQERVYYFFGKANAGAFIYCVKQTGELIHSRERIRPEWS
jgi:hypothetical protein